MRYRRGQLSIDLLRLGLVAGTALATPAAAQELLLNRSFEAPVAPANGNNFYVTMPNWTVVPTPVVAMPINIVRPFAGYPPGGPATTPAGGGVQYFDVNAAAGTVSQPVTFPGAGMVDFSCWFSVRDNPQAQVGTIQIIDSGNFVVASASISFTAADPLGIWRRAVATNIPVAAGNHIFRIVMGNPSNADLASLVYKPPLAMTKTNAVYSDPSNGLVNPKLIPGAFTNYALRVSNPATYTVTANTVRVADATPASMELFVGDFGGPGSGPATFVNGVPSSALTYTFTSLASTTDDIEFSNNGGTTWTHVPVADANGVDPAVTHVRMLPKGTMAAGSNFTFNLRYRVK